MKGMVGLVLGALCAVVIACASGGGKMQSTAPPTAPMGGGVPEGRQSPHDQIDRLANDIAGESASLGIAQVECTGASCAQIEPMSKPVMPTAECKPATETCKQSCSLSDSICSNASKICNIAGQLAGDAWAAKKCNDGNATCDAAKTKCCDCAK